MAKIKITPAGIKRSLKNYNYLQAIGEYVWNGFDAGAQVIRLAFTQDELQGIKRIEIQDNGCGIQHESLNNKFGPFLESEKFLDPTKKRHTSVVHGKNGYGRLTFFKFALIAEWDTVYAINGNCYQYQVSIKSDELDNYTNSEPFLTTQDVGTKVTFKAIIESIDVTEIEEYLGKEFGWFLELNKAKEFAIKIDEKDLDYSKLINEMDKIELIHPTTGRIFEVRYIQWVEKLDEYSKYYFIDSNNIEKFKKTTSLNNKGDSFYHSLFIRSDYFDSVNCQPADEEDEIQFAFFDIRQDEEYKFLINQVAEFLKKKRKPFLRKYTDKLIEQLESNKAFPKFDVRNIWEKHKKDELEIVVRELYQVEPKIFSKLNGEQQRTFVHLINLVIDSGENESLFKILNEIIELDSDEREDLVDILKTTKLSRIIKTIKLIQDRYRAINQLRDLVLVKVLKANERDHIQKFIESHFWIFGEQYNLVTAAEPKFEEALRRFTNILKGVNISKKKKINHPDKNKEMDIFMVRQDFKNNLVNSVVVELKHPSITLGEKELTQVKKYMNVIVNEDDFNGSNLFWEFYLVGNDYNSYIEGEITNAENHGEKSLVYKVNKYKVYVKKWSEIFTEFELRHKFLNDKLELERNGFLNDSSQASEIIDRLKENTAIQK